MIPSLLLLILSWLPVAVDCHGMPEGVDYYEVVVLGAYVSSWQVVDGAEYPVYTRTVNVYRVPQADGGSCYSRPFPCVVLPDPVDPPPLGGFSYIGDPVAVDQSGNRSDQPCP